MTTGQPPRVPERLLAALVPAAARDEILGDLHEEHARRARGPGRFAASVARGWYWREASRLGASMLAGRIRAALTLPATVPGAPPVSGESSMRILGLDFRYAWRWIARRPASSALIVVTLALGLGTNAAIFGVIDALVLRPFSLPNLDRLTLLSETTPEDGIGYQENASPANFLDWKRDAGVFDRLAAFEWWDVNFAGGDEPERVPGFFVSADFFPAVGVEPALGRAFLPEEEQIGRHRRAVIGHGLWERRFGGDPAVIGRTVQLDAVPYEIVGVAPRGFDFPQGAQIWAPLAMSAETAALRRPRYLTAIGRLAPGRTLEEAQARMAVVARRLEEQHPEDNRGRSVRVLTLVAGMADPGLGPILVLWQCSAVFVLLIACANIANLLLVRAADRQRELAVRAALGASRGRLLTPLMLESATLALLAVPLALALAAASLEIIQAAMPARLIRFVSGWDAMRVDARGVAFTAVLALAAAVVFGLVPALQAARGRVVERLKDGGRGSTAGRHRLRRGLVVAEIALALPLLVAAALGTLSAQRFLNGPQGYDPDNLLVFRAVLPDGKYAEPESRRRFVAEVLERLRALPGVGSTAAVNVLPSGTSNSNRTVEIEGRAEADPSRRPSVDYRAASPEYFATMGIPIARGRGFTAADRDGAQPVAIVSDAMARRFWPDRDPVGERLRLGSSEEWVTVVGVAGDVVHDWFGRRNYPTVFRPYEQAPTGHLGFAVRTLADPSNLALPATRAVRAVDPAQPVFDLMPMRRLLHERTIGLQYVAGIMMVFGVLALILAVVGVYGVMAYLMLQRTHELGVRVALGAPAGHVYRITLGLTMRLAAAGVTIGVGMSLLVGRFMEASLSGAVAADARVLAVITGVLALTALAAGYVPARRAARVDPLVALREP